MKKRRIFDETFKQMAVELSHVKGAEQEVARQLGIDSGRITKWRQSHKSSGQPPTAGLSEEQKQSKRLEKELKEAQLERAILWRGSASSPGERGNIRVYCRKRQPISPLERWVRCSRWVVVGTITAQASMGASIGLEPGNSKQAGY
jgi:transposase